MIARWMLAAICFSTLIAIAALAAEYVLRAWRRPLRGPWVVGLAVGVVWPLLAPIILTARSTTMVVQSTTIAVGATGAATAIDALSASWLERLDPALLMAWAFATALLVVQVALAVRALRRVQRRATHTALDGEAVLLDQELGPAVIGLRRPRIVVPTWLLDLDAPLRALVLKHEREHCRAGDPILVWLSVVATTVIPWNPAIWWMARRLRAAMEIDCDTRTVRDVVDVQRYASLLLLIAQRHTSARFVSLLSPSASQLTRRISSMQSAIPRFRAMRSIIATSLVAVALFAACSSRIAANLTSPAPQARVDESMTPLPDAPALTTPSGDRSASLRASRLNEPRYPAAAKAARITGAVTAMYVVNSDGSVDTTSFKVVAAVASDSNSGSRDAFVQSVRASLNDFRYEPAQRAGQNVRQLVRARFAFEVAGAVAAGTTSARMTSAGPIAVAAGASAPATPASPTSQPSDKPYFDFQVERPATVVPGSQGPEYPQALRAAKVEGKVLVQFVVDTMGVPQMSTFKVLKTDQPEFAEAVRTALATMRFEPARVGGRAVKQLMQSPFAFRLSR